MAAVTTYNGSDCPGAPRHPPGRPACRHRTRAPPEHRAVYWRRRLAVVALAVGLVVVAAQAGAALGGSPLAAPERRPASSIATSKTVVEVTPAPATRSGRSSRAPSPVRTRVPGSTSWSRPATAPRCVPGEVVGSAPLGRRPSRANVVATARSLTTVAACAVRTAGSTTTRWSTRGRPTRARRSGGGGSASPAGGGSPPTSASRKPRSWSRKRSGAIVSRSTGRSSRPGSSWRSRGSAVDARRGRRSSPTTSRSGPGARAPRCAASASASPCSSACGRSIPVSYLRFASVYKGFEDVGDFEREVVELQKTTEPKRRVARTNNMPRHRDSGRSQRIP